MTGNAQPMVHVVDDDDSVRRSLVSLLEGVGIPVATFPSAEVFLKALRDDTRGCILLDVRMPGMSGLQLQQALRERDVTMPTIILTGHADVPMAVSAMSAGAAGFVEKPFHPQELLDRIHDCLEADSRQAALRAERRQARDALARLSSREQEVLRQLVTGKPSKLIASALGISEKTVDVHRSNLMRKTGTRSVAELMRIWFLIHPVEEQMEPPSPPQRIG
jgi:FixJ family two-component response regulator